MGRVYGLAPADMELLTFDQLEQVLEDAKALAASAPKAAGG